MSPESIEHALRHGPAALVRECHADDASTVDEFSLPDWLGTVPSQPWVQVHDPLADPADSWDRAYDAHRDSQVGL